MNPYRPPEAPLESRQSADARDQRVATRYVLGAIAIGAMEVVDGAILVERRGDYGGISILFSLIELAWLVISIYAVIRIRRRDARLVAVAFLAYILVGTAVAALVGAAETVPVWFAAFGGLFGFAYACGAICAFALMRRHPEPKEL